MFEARTIELFTKILKAQSENKEKRDFEAKKMFILQNDWGGGFLSEMKGRVTNENFPLK